MSEANLNEDAVKYKVVVNHEEQYSIWLAARENPKGWRDAGMAGTKPECLEYVNRVWTDMRPLSLRIKMDGPSLSQEDTSAGNTKSKAAF